MWKGLVYSDDEIDGKYIQRFPQKRSRLSNCRYFIAVNMFFLLFTEEVEN